MVKIYVARFVKHGNKRYRDEHERYDLQIFSNALALMEAWSTKVNGVYRMLSAWDVKQPFLFVNSIITDMFFVLLIPRELLQLRWMI